MSTLGISDVYFHQSPAATPAPLEVASAGGPAMSSGKLPAAAWIAFIVILVAIRMLWEYSD